MSREDSQDSSLTPRATKRFHVSQIVLVVFLIIFIIVAVVISLYKGWQNVREKTNDEETPALLAEIAESASNSKKVLDEIGAIIAQFNPSSGDTAEQAEVTIPDKEYTTTTVSRSYSTYINYDWNVSFTLPPGWSYNRDTSSFISKDEAIGIARIEEFIIPEAWLREGGNTEQLFVETTEDGNVYHYTMTIESFTYIFTTSDSVSDQAYSIIMSLQSV